MIGSVISDNMVSIELPEMRGKVGDTFEYSTGKHKHTATIVGYHVEYDTDTKSTLVVYRVAADHLVAPFNLARSTVDRALIAKG